MNRTFLPCQDGDHTKCVGKTSDRFGEDVCGCACHQQNAVFAGLERQGDLVRSEGWHN